MRIIYILSSTGKLGGATKSFLNLLGYMICQGNQVYVIVPDKNGLYQDFKTQNIPVYALPYYFNCKAQKSIKSIVFSAIKRIYNYYSAIKLSVLCKSIKPDIIHSNTSVNNIGYYAGKWNNIPHVWHIREYGQKDFGFTVRNLQKCLTAPNNYTISITDDIANDKGLSSLSTHKTIYNGIVSTEEHNSISPKHNYFLYAGRIEKSKGIEDLLKAFVDFKKRTNSKIKLKVAGHLNQDGEAFRTHLLQILKDANLENDVDWLGDIHPISPLMQQAVATIVPSIFEGFGRVTAEAMNEGSLVIGRNTGGTKEQFDNGLRLTGKEIGLRFLTVKELSKQLETVVNLSSTEYDSIVSAAQQTVKSLYGIEDYGAKILSFYKDIITNEKFTSADR